MKMVTDPIYTQILDKKIFCMFKDYYAFLEISEIATQKEIKAAFKKQALIWHPDRNIGIDTSMRMQEINEAYLILKNTEARERYDIEYQKFRLYLRESEQTHFYEKRQSESHHYTEESWKQKEKLYKYTDYSINDNILVKWMDNARKEAVNLTQKTIQDLKGIAKYSAKPEGKKEFNWITVQFIIGIIVLILLVMLKNCNGIPDYYDIK